MDGCKISPSFVNKTMKRPRSTPVVEKRNQRVGVKKKCRPVGTKTDISLMLQNLCLPQRCPLPPPVEPPSLNKIINTSPIISLEKEPVLATPLIPSPSIEPLPLTPAYDKKQDLPLCDRYRPQDVKQLLNNNDAVASLTKWLTDKAMKKEEHHHAAFVHGKVGAGKSTGVRVILRSLGYEWIEFNTINVKKKGKLERRIWRIVNGRPNKFAVILEDYEGIHALKTLLNRIENERKMEITSTGNEGIQGESQEPPLTFTSLVGKLSKNCCPVIFICSDKADRKVREIAHLCLSVLWKSPTIPKLKELIKQIVYKEKWEMHPTVIETFSQRCCKNLHTLLNALNMYEFSSGSGLAKIIEGNKLAMSSCNDDFWHYFDSMEKLLNFHAPTFTMEAAHAFYEIDTSIVVDGVYENYTKTSSSIEALSQEADLLSDFDMCGQKEEVGATVVKGCSLLVHHKKYGATVKPVFPNHTKQAKANYLQRVQRIRTCRLVGSCPIEESYLVGQLHQHHLHERIEKCMHSKEFSEEDLADEISRRGFGADELKELARVEFYSTLQVCQERPLRSVLDQLPAKFWTRLVR